MPGSDEDAQHQAYDDAHVNIALPGDHHGTGNRTDEADDRAYRQVDVAAGHDTEQHTDRHDDDVAVLGDDVGEVLG